MNYFRAISLVLCAALSAPVIVAQSGLADTFDGSSLDASWLKYQEAERLDPVDGIVVTGGQLKLHCDSIIPWFNADESFLMYKEMTGAWDISTTVRVRKYTDQDADTTAGYRFGGIMIRRPGEGYKFIVVGRRGGSGNQIETKNTDETVGDSGVDAWDTPDGEQQSELRLKRDAGGVVTAWSRIIGGNTWTSRSWDSAWEPDLGDVDLDTVQVGLIVYGLSSGPADFVGIFDEVADVTSSPTASITSPLSGRSYTTCSSTIAVNGTGSDDVGVTGYDWDNDAGGSGSVGGGSSFSITGISLTAGVNVITVTANDVDTNTGDDSITVTYKP